MPLQTNKSEAPADQSAQLRPACQTRGRAEGERLPTEASRVSLAACGSGSPPQRAELHWRANEPNEITQGVHAEAVLEAIDAESRRGPFWESPQTRYAEPAKPRRRNSHDADPRSVAAAGPLLWIRATSTLFSRK